MAPAESITVAVRDIKQGDVIPGVWTATGDAVEEDGRVKVPTRSIEIGGLGTSEYADPAYELTVLRPGSDDD